MEVSMRGHDKREVVESERKISLGDVSVEAAQSELRELWRTQEELSAKSWILAKLERRYVLGLEDIAKRVNDTPPSSTSGSISPPDLSKLADLSPTDLSPSPREDRDEDLNFSTYVGDSVQEFGFQDAVAQFFFVCHSLHMTGMVELRQVNLAKLFEILDGERESLGDCRWMEGPVHGQLAKKLAEEKLTPKDWDMSFLDRDALARRDTELSDEQKVLLERLSDMYYFPYFQL